MYVFLADVVAGLHLGYVLAVVFGLLLTLSGKPMGWAWVGNRWFRGAHLLMIAGVVARASVWPECPLTVWERDLRAAAGQVDFAGSPVGKFFHDLIHPPPTLLPSWAYLVIYASFGLLVVAALWLVPVRWRSRRDAAPEAA